MPALFENESATAEPSKREICFPFRGDLNDKIALWFGDICHLQIDAIVNSTNESLNDLTGISGEIFRAAGGQLEDECNELEGCRTGEAKSTGAYNLPCKRIIHTAGPRFNVKYRTAAENSLHSCYRHSLQVLTEQNLRTIAFCCINSERKGYPRESGTHIAARTVRRFLEHHESAIDLVVFCVNHEDDMDCYTKILPLYFPRSVLEEQSLRDTLPEDIGNEHGETVSDERRIRIHSVPGLDSTTINKNVLDHESVTFLKSVQDSFGSMQGDTDAQRLATISKTKQQLEMEEKEREYARYLQRARSENFADIEKMELLHIGGTDEMGRIVVSLIAGNFPHSSEADYDRLLLYIIRELDLVVEREYVIVYFHTKTDSERQPPFSWIKKAMAMLTRKYRKNLKNLLIVHPTMWMKMVFWVITPFVSSKFWQKLVYIDKLQTLMRYVPPQLVKIPKFVEEYDARIWGTMVPTTKSEDSL
eukprot:c5529_g1_i1.p1 GENE.c5529_g1_i1~~c5529_g1_i1.p1  ORF type:complete len:514 (+),score=106.34 c5529_g1_i1:118-1542(+)